MLKSHNKLEVQLDNYTTQNLLKLLGELKLTVDNGLELIIPMILNNQVNYEIVKKMIKGK